MKFILAIVLSFISVSAYADDLTLADVAAAQEQNMSAVETMEMQVETATEFDGKSQNLTYDIKSQNLSDGNVRTMVTTVGNVTMQFLVDTSDMSVTYLMADGSTKKITMTAEDKAQIMQMTGLNSLNRTGSVYAALGIDRKSATDASYEGVLDKKEYETDDVKIRVKGNKGGWFNSHAEVEYVNKRIKDVRKEIDENIAKLEAKPAAKEGAKRLKRTVIDNMKKNKEKTIRYMTARRVEKINMKTGMVEEQEMFNEGGERIGRIKVKRTSEIRPGRAVKNNNNSLTMAAETEAEMTGSEGTTKSRTMITGIRVNEGVEFEWMKTNIIKEGKK